MKNAYRKMYPMMNSEKNWLLKVVMSNIVNEPVEPERKAQNAIFNIDNEMVTFTGTEKMSPYNFDTFSCIVLNLTDSLNVGLIIM